MVSEDYILFVRANMRIITRNFFSENVRYAQKNYVVFFSVAALQFVVVRKNSIKLFSVEVTRHGRSRLPMP